MTDLKYLYMKFQNYLSGFGKSVYISEKHSAVPFFTDKSRR